MAAPAYRHVQDQNLNFLYKSTTTGEKTDAPKPAKKGGLGGRKALNDISNSRKPSVLQIKKEDSKQVISIEKDPFVCKGKSSKPPEKGKTAGRKALSDLTNSVKTSSQLIPKTGQKLVAVAENVPSCMVEERFLHNHQKCIKAQTKAVDMDFFLKSVGLNNDISLCTSPRRTFKPSSKKDESDRKNLEMEEMPEQMFGDEAPLCIESELSGYFSPACRSPKSPTPPYMNWEEYNFSDMVVINSP